MKKIIKLLSTFLVTIYSLTVVSQSIGEHEVTSMVWNVENCLSPTNNTLTDEQKTNTISHYTCENLGEVYKIVNSNGQLLIYVNGTLYSTKDLSVINCNEGLLTSWFFTDSCDFNTFTTKCINLSDLVASQSSYKRDVELSLIDEGSEFVFPNPVSDAINIIVGEEDTEIMIYSMEGVLHQRVFISGNSTGIMNFDVGDLIPGVYLVRIVSLNSSKTTKFIRL